jgi:hypothetical protein
MRMDADTIQFNLAILQINFRDLLFDHPHLRPSAFICGFLIRNYSMSSASSAVN